MYSTSPSERRQHDPCILRDSAPGPFATRERVAAILAAAGFTDVVAARDEAVQTSAATGFQTRK